MSDDSTREKRPESADKPQNSDITIPILPVVLGVGALVVGAALLFVVAGSSKKRTIEWAPPPTASTLANESRNPWIRVENAPGKTLGVADGDVPASVRGFRPAQAVSVPARPFEMQQHEVTWEELDAWLAKNPGKTFAKPPAELANADRKSFPAVGVPWAIAAEYCQAMGGTLPTEEQWESAARGRDLSNFPWGNAESDVSRIHAFKGNNAQPGKVMSNSVDRTNGVAEKAIYDLAGNVQEWTSSIWRDDAPGDDLSWVNNEGTVVYAIRGFPLYRDMPERLDELSVAYRDWVCATGDCSPLSAGAPARDRARRPKIELWAGADSTTKEALELRRVFEKSNVLSGLSKCFFDRVSMKVTLKSAKESFCPRAEHVPANGKCGPETAMVAPLLRIRGDLPETALKCINYTLHGVSAANVDAKLPETQISYALHVETNPMQARENIGFRCVRDVSAP